MQGLHALVCFLKLIQNSQRAARENEENLLLVKLERQMQARDKSNGKEYIWRLTAAKIFIVMLPLWHVLQGDVRVCVR